MSKKQAAGQIFRAQKTVAQNGAFLIILIPREPLGTYFWSLFCVPHFVFLGLVFWPQEFGSFATWSHFVAPGVPAAGVPLRIPGCEILVTLQRPRLWVQVGTSSIGQCDKAGAGYVSLRMNRQMLDAASRSKRDCRGKEWRHHV